MILPSSTLAADTLQNLERSLQEWYASVGDYAAFSKPTSHENLATVHIFGRVRQRIDAGDVPRVLELGAGRSLLGLQLRQTFGDRVAYLAHDVVDRNSTYYRDHGIPFSCADLESLEGSWDIIVSFYVFEHVPRPSAFLLEARRLLTPTGAHLVFCPEIRLRLIGIPSLRHLGWGRQIRIGLQLATSRLAARLERRPRFLINTDPACLHYPRHFTDSDMVHLVDRADLHNWCRQHRMACEDLSVPARFALAAGPIKDFAIKKLMTVAVAMTPLP